METRGLFVRAATFRQLGGYRALRLMEDLDFSRRLKRMGRSVVLPASVETSGRRFLTRGPWRTLAFIVWLLLLSTLRLDTERYAERWRGPADRVPGSPGGADASARVLAHLRARDFPMASSSCLSGEPAAFLRESEITPPAPCRSSRQRLDLPAMPCGQDKGLGRQGDPVTVVAHLGPGGAAL